MAVINNKTKPEKIKRAIDKSHHDYLCKKAETWLKKTHTRELMYLSSCSIVLKEYASYSIEQPDCIGFNSCYSVLVECKTSRSDFLADRKKVFRILPDKGMGNYRFYLCDEGLLSENELPEKWGLLELVNNKIVMKKRAEKFDNVFENEKAIIISALNKFKNNAKK